MPVLPLQLIVPELAVTVPLPEPLVVTVSAYWGTPLSVTVKVWPPTVNVPVLELPDVFTATE